jgi:tetratricopeptide (TPR) repeat protein
VSGSTPFQALFADTLTLLHSRCLVSQVLRSIVGVRQRRFYRFVPLFTLTLPALSAAQSATLSPAYESALRRYQSGDREGAIADVSTWPESRLRAEISALAGLGRRAQACRPCAASIAWEQLPVTTALVLHGDCAQRARRDKMSPELHESLAAEIAGMLAKDPARRPFARRWYEAMAGLAQGENRWADALAWADRGLRELPDSVEILLVVGSLEETFGAISAPVAPQETLVGLTESQTRSNRRDFQDAREHLERARRALRAAVAADSSLAEARLRLGRVAWRLGDAAEARAALLEALARKPEAATAFLAHLFLGRLDEDAGRLDDAAASYEFALALAPHSQSARLGLSHVRFRRGDAAGARAEVEKAVGGSGRRQQRDAFWLYPWAPSVGVEDRLEALRREATS